MLIEFGTLEFFSCPPHAFDVSKLYSEGMAILSYCSENAPNSFLVNVSFEYSSVCVCLASRLGNVFL